MSKRLLLALFVFLVAALPMRADFDSLVRAVHRRGLHRVWMPGLGLARCAIWIVHPAGVHDFQLATFNGGGRLDGADLQALLRANSEAGFTPIVQAHERGGDTTVIWARPGHGDTVEIMLLTHEPGDETTVLRAVVDVAVFARQVHNPKHAGDIASR
jgi:hypothetical protein